jgi:hypothetical protein
MTRIVWISLLSGLLFGAPLFAEDFLILDDMDIKGEVREPAVEIISSRILPSIEGFRMEKSFLQQARQPDPNIVELPLKFGIPVRMLAPELLLERPRALLRLKEAKPRADEAGAPDMDKL